MIVGRLIVRGMLWRQKGREIFPLLVLKMDTTATSDSGGTGNACGTAGAENTVS